MKFQEPLIEEAVRLMLDRPDGALTMDDLAQVEELYIQSNTACASMDEFYEVRGVWFGTDTRIRGPITDLSDLSQMPNLVTVEMSTSEQYRMEELIAEYGEPGFQIIYI